MTKNLKIKLLMTPRSPFARRVRFNFKRLGVSFFDQEVNIFNPSNEFLADAPLGWAPSLVIEENGYVQKLSDSQAILEWMDDRFQNEGGIWPKDFKEKYRVMQISTLAEGIITASVSYFLETQRKTPDEGWLDEHLSIIKRVLDHLENDLLDSDYTQTLNQGSRDIGVALEYLELRIPQSEWSKEHPKLVRVLQACKNIQGFQDTSPPPVVS